MPARVSNAPHAPNRQPRTQERIEGGLDLASAGHQHRLDHIAVDIGKSLNQRVLRLHVGIDGARGLLGRNLGRFFVEAHAGLGRLGVGRRRCDVIVGGGSGSGRIVVVVEVELARRRWALWRLQQLEGSFPRGVVLLTFSVVGFSDMLDVVS
jgi:hypothetical protein